MIVSDSHKCDLKFLQEQPPSILSDFCKLASNFLSRGYNTKLYSAASQKLKVDIKQIQTSVEGLAYLFIEAAKHDLDKDSFRGTILSLNLPDTFLEPIYNSYQDVKNDLKQSLPEVGFQHFQYKNLEWRFQSQTSSRAMIKQTEMVIIMQFDFEKTGKSKRICVQSDIQNLLHMNQQINQALQNSKTNHSKKIQHAIT